ncbi:MAG: alpha/beta fold hydrolase [Paracoccaceae bacterium]
MTSDLYVERLGAGAQIVTMHGGLGLDHSYFRPWLDGLSGIGTLVYYDHRGNGRSPRPGDWAGYDFDLLVEDADAVARDGGDDPFVLIGHSYGGFIAQHYTIAHPERLRGLILMNTAPAFDYQPAFDGTEAQMAALTRALSEPMPDDATWRETWMTLSQMYYRRFDAEVAARLDAATVYSAQAWNAANGLLATFDTREGLAALKGVPTLVIGGRHDPITPPGPGAERIAGLIEGAELAIFEESGHFPFIEETAAVETLLKDWIGALRM